MSSKSSKTHTGDPTPYDDDAADDFAEELADAWGEWEDEQIAPTRMTISSVVEWSGSTNRAHDGHRTVRLDGLDLGDVRDKLNASRTAADRAERAQEATSYRAQGWHAQINALTRSAHGSELADRAGLNPTARTLSTWLAEGRTPSRANRERIAEAYAGLRTRGADQARQEQVRAAREAVDAVSDAVRDRYGAEVRFFNIRDIEFED